MNVTPCHYAIVRFLPFVETGEFANVGVVLFAPLARKFTYKLLTRRVARITAFFEKLEAPYVRAAIRHFEDELNRIDQLFKQAGTDRRIRQLDVAACMAIWNGLLGPTETMLRFGESRVIMAADPQAKMRELFDFYVERNFVTREYQEQALDRTVRRLLYSADLGSRFGPQVIGNDDYHARFPFVETTSEGPVKVIKPLHLTHADAARIIDHGGQWVVRVKALRNRGLLPPEVLFAVDGSDVDLNTPRGRARREVIDELSQLVDVAPLNESQRIIAFASA